MLRKSELSLFCCRFHASVCERSCIPTMAISSVTCRSTLGKKKSCLVLVRLQTEHDSPSDNNATSLVSVSGLTKDCVKNCNILLFIYGRYYRIYRIKWWELPRCKANDEISIFSTLMVRGKLMHLLVEQKRRLNAHPECWWPRGMTEWAVATATALQLKRVGGSEGNVN